MRGEAAGFLKAEKFKELKNKKGTAEYDAWFLRYRPADTKKDKEDKDKDKDKDEDEESSAESSSSKQKTKSKRKRRKKTKKRKGFFGF